MLKTPIEIQLALGEAIRARRIRHGWSQEEAARRAGMGLSTWKRMETRGPSLVLNVINAAIAMRCEDGIDQLFPPLAASSLDELPRTQVVEAKKSRQRVSRRRSKL